MRRSPAHRRICFVTGSRAEFGLMATTLRAILSRQGLELVIVATGMHLHPAHGEPLSAIRAMGFEPDAVVSWHAGAGLPADEVAGAVGLAVAELAEAFVALRPDVVMVTGDRVEAFAAAAAAHLSRIPIAHVHGGDRALGQIDDSLRHAITKLSHIHFAATAGAARRIARLGEDRWRIHRVGSPGNDGLSASAATRRELAVEFPGLAAGRYALLVLHPVEADARVEARRAKSVLCGVDRIGFDHVVIIYPNNDPGAEGIARVWDGLRGKSGYTVRPDVARPTFLGLMRDAAVLVGNSSSGIIEAAGFGMRVVDIGPRQAGREKSGNVRHCGYEAAEIARALKKVWNNGKARRWRGDNVYGGDGAGGRIARVLAGADLSGRLMRKLIVY